MKKYAVEIVHIYEMEVEDDFNPDDQDYINECLPREWVKDDQLVYEIVGDLDSEGTADNRRDYEHTRMLMAMDGFTADLRNWLIGKLDIKPSIVLAHHKHKVSQPVTEVGGIKIGDRVIAKQDTLLYGDKQINRGRWYTIVNQSDLNHLAALDRNTEGGVSAYFVLPPKVLPGTCRSCGSSWNECNEKLRNDSNPCCGTCHRDYTHNQQEWSKVVGPSVDCEEYPIGKKDHPYRGLDYSTPGDEFDQCQFMNDGTELTRCNRPRSEHES